MQKNAKIGCFEHLWLHHIHVSVQGYTIGKALFDPKKNSYLLTTNNGSLFHSRIGECSSSARRAREGHEPIRE